MGNLNDLYYFVVVVRYGGFSSAARATGIEKTKLSRRIAALEADVGVRLLQRSTRKLVLTDSGQSFFERASEIVEAAKTALDSLAELSKEPAGTVRVSSSVVLAQSYMAPILPSFLEKYPKIRIIVDSTDREIDLVGEQIDLALRARESVEDTQGLVARVVGKRRRIVVASPVYLNKNGRPVQPSDIEKFATMSVSRVGQREISHWTFTNTVGLSAVVDHKPVLLTNDMRFQLEAAKQGMGIALLPEPVVSAEIRLGTLEHVLPDWWASEMTIYLVYPSPRGIRPAVRCLIDYLLFHLPVAISQHDNGRSLTEV